jgi:hypothetical protein
LNMVLVGVGRLWFEPSLVFVTAIFWPATQTFVRGFFWTQTIRLRQIVCDCESCGLEPFVRYNKGTSILIYIDLKLDFIYFNARYNVTTLSLCLGIGEQEIGYPLSARCPLYDSHCAFFLVWGESFW